MKTIYTTSQQNVSNNERGFRVFLSLGLLTAVIVGSITAPATIAAVSMVSIYLVTTAILAIDPVYAAMQSLSKAVNSDNDNFLTA